VLVEIGSHAEAAARACRNPARTREDLGIWLGLLAEAQERLVARCRRHGLPAVAVEPSAGPEPA